jgi:hydroxymethylpyrimidine pyrophosphatase-like HAD family hydrolase
LFSNVLRREALGRPEVVHAKEGILAFDLDGTLTDKNHALPPPTVSMLRSLHEAGWVVFFVTGRTLPWSLAHLSSLAIPFYLAPYNGACVRHFPGDEYVHAACMNTHHLRLCERFFPDFGGVVYTLSGRAVYTHLPTSPRILEHVRKRRSLQHEEWELLPSLSSVENEGVASVRFFAPPLEASMLSHLLGEGSALHAPTMKDSFDESLSVVQVTAPYASKGQALLSVRRRYPGVPVIAAGNDENDIPLLQCADIGIAVGKDAPLILRKLAHVKAASPEEIPQAVAVGVQMAQKKMGVRASRV